MRRTSLVQRLFAIALVVWAVDFLTKNWAIANLSSSPKKLIGDFLQLTLLRNPGAAFSMATGFTIIFTSISIGVAIFIARYATRITSAWWAVVAGLVLGGVLGNLTDRAFRELARALLRELGEARETREVPRFARDPSGARVVGMQILDVVREHGTALSDGERMVLDATHGEAGGEKETPVEEQTQFPSPD